MATEGISSSTPVSAPPRPSAADNRRVEEARVERERVQQEQTQNEARQAQEARQREPVVNTQGQTTGRIVNTTA